MVASYAQICLMVVVLEKCVAGNQDAGCRRLLDPHCTLKREGRISCSFGID
jgi:hypothetical protein